MMQICATGVLLLALVGCAVQAGMGGRAPHAPPATVWAQYQTDEAELKELLGLALERELRLAAAPCGGADQSGYADFWTSAWADKNLPRLHILTTIVQDIPEAPLRELLAVVMWETDFVKKYQEAVSKCGLKIRGKQKNVERYLIGYLMEQIYL